MVMNSPYCEDIVKKNHVLVMFDKWENELKSSGGEKDRRKCLHPYPDHCGRSPTTLTMEDIKLVKASKMLFARKFDRNISGSLELMHKIDEWRKEAEVVEMRMGETPDGMGVTSHQEFMLRVSNPRDLITYDNIEQYKSEHKLISSRNAHLIIHIQEKLYNYSHPEADEWWDADMCISNNGGLAERLSVAKCNASNNNQWFALGIDYIYTHCMLLYLYMYI